MVRTDSPSPDEGVEELVHKEYYKYLCRPAGYVRSGGEGPITPGTRHARSRSIRILCNPERSSRQNDFIGRQKAGDSQQQYEYSIEVEKGLKSKVEEDKDWKKIEPNAHSPGRVSQKLGVQGC